MWCGQHPHPGVSDPKMREILTSEFLPEEWKVQAPHQSPQLRGLPLEDELQEHLALTTKGAYIWESQRVIRNRFCS